MRDINNRKIPTVSRHHNVMPSKVRPPVFSFLCLELMGETASCLTFTTPASATSAAAEATTTSTGAQVLKSEDANFFYFCDT
jgi:hypothetical protein